MEKANELLIEEAIVRITFKQWLDREYQKHCVLHKANTLQEFLESAREFEKIANIGNSAGNLTMMTSEGTEIQKSDRDKIWMRFMRC